jgi:hypothetical protein
VSGESGLPNKLLAALALQVSSPRCRSKMAKAPFEAEAKRNMISQLKNNSDT